MLDNDQIRGFLDDTAMLGTPESFATYASASSIYKMLRARIESGTLTGSDIQSFVSNLMCDFQPGRTFYGDKVLALLARVVAGGPEPFAQRYLEDLAELQCPELLVSSHVARLTLGDREKSSSLTKATILELSNAVFLYSHIEFFWTIYPPTDRTEGVPSASAWLDWEAA